MDQGQPSKSLLNAKTFLEKVESKEWSEHKKIVGMRGKFLRVFMKDSMDEKLQNIITTSTFKILDEEYVYAKVKTCPKSNDHFMITNDGYEITVVTTEDKLDDLNIIEQNRDFYKLISVNVSLPFYATGFLAAVSSAIVKKGSGTLTISTFSKDYIAVRVENLAKARRALIELGMKEK